MLAGVGGKTIAEAQQRMSLSEFNRWIQFRNQYGPLTNGWRLEHLLAQVSFLLARLAGSKNAKMDDFLPKWEMPAEEKEATIEDVFRILTGGRNGK